MSTYKEISAFKKKRTVKEDPLVAHQLTSRSNNKSPLPQRQLFATVRGNQLSPQRRSAKNPIANRKTYQQLQQYMQQNSQLEIINQEAEVTHETQDVSDLANNDLIDDHISLPKIKRNSQESNNQSDINTLSQQMIESNAFTTQQIVITTQNSYMHKTETPQLIKTSDGQQNSEPKLYHQLNSTPESNGGENYRLFHNTSKSFHISQGSTVLQQPTNNNNNSLHNPNQSHHHISNTEPSVQSRQALLKSELNKIKVHNTQDTIKYSPDYENDEDDEDENEDEEEQMDQVYITNQKFRKQRTKSSARDSNQGQISDRPSTNKQESSLSQNKISQNHLNSYQNSQMQSQQQKYSSENVSQMSPSQIRHYNELQMLDLDPENLVLHKIYEAISQRHDLLGSKKGLPYKKFKHQTLNELSFDQQPSMDVTNLRMAKLIVPNPLIDDHSTKQKKYINYVKSKLKYSIDGSPIILERKPKPHLISIHQKPIQINETAKESSILEATKRHFEYNRLRDALQFKPVTKDQLQRHNNEKLNMINQSLLDPQEHALNTQTHVLFSQNTTHATGIFYDKDAECQSHQFQVNKSVHSSRVRPQHARLKSQSNPKEDSMSRVKLSKIEIMLPILNKDQTIYALEQLNNDSIKEQRQVVNKFIDRFQNGGSHSKPGQYKISKTGRAQSMVDQNTNDNRNQLRSLMASNKRQSVAHQQETNQSKKNQKQLFEKQEELRFQNEIKFLASQMAL
ncbi:UNKNOWN [Stylonychia lemnae]|uniref:Uncharacterized protein n=1 Tax=Stylonychia lemnae TaxID=5949 RepID=A0A078A3J8_STYLE|nr:UNKNOWN [Stylonychia lemnae]|eukprot:CDW76752.1 UNKNOWN [Stylonychia lemnae]